MDWAASTTPASTSAREVSTIRAMKGAAETTRGTMAPRMPILVPTMSLVKSMMAIIRMMKGRERPTLMIQPTIRLTHLWGQMPWGWVMFSSTPRGRPRT